MTKAFIETIARGMKTLLKLLNMALIFTSKKSITFPAANCPILRVISNYGRLQKKITLSTRSVWINSFTSTSILCQFYLQEDFEFPSSRFGRVQHFGSKSAFYQVKTVQRINQSGNSSITESKFGEDKLVVLVLQGI